MKKITKYSTLSANVAISTLGPDRDISGEFKVISNRHSYNRQCGIDIYPTEEQYSKLSRGEPIRLGVKQ